MTVPRSSIDRRIDSCVRADRHLHQVSLIAEDLALGEPAARPNSARDDDVDHQRLVVASTIGRRIRTNRRNARRPIGRPDFAVQFEADQGCPRVRVLAAQL